MLLIVVIAISLPEDPTNITLVPRVRYSLSEGMISIQDVKSVIIDIVAAMAEMVRVAEEKVRNCFLGRTNIYRCEDGRPICYCCLRVGHVAKYCWDKKYACPHASFDQPTIEQSSPGASVDVESLERDIKRLLNEVQGITRDLELSNTTPFRAEDLRVETGAMERSPQVSTQCPTMERPNIPEMKQGRI